MTDRSMIRFKSWLWLLFLFEICCAEQVVLSNLDPDGFEQRTLSPGTFAVAFCVPWFEPCKSLHEELAIAADSLRITSDISIYAVDCEKNESLCTSLDVISFPTIRVFDHQKWSRYRGPQKATRIVTHLLKQVTDSLIELDEEKFTVMKSLEQPLMVMTRPQDDDSSVDLLRSLVKENLLQDFFVAVMAPSTATDAGETASLTVYNIHDETTPSYNGSFERKAILDFARRVSQPLFRPFDLSSIVSFMKAGLPIGMLYSADEHERKSLAESLASVAMKYRGKVNFATVDAIKNSFSLEPMGLKLDQLPAFIIQTDDNIYKYKLGSKITSGAIDEFIRRTLFPHEPQVVQPTAPPVTRTR